MKVGIDVSIEDIKKSIKTQKRAAEILTRNITAVEKMDGTKLTLLRNDEKFDPKNYAKNWIVAYKGNVISAQEFSGLAGREEEIRKKSLGTSQYKFVHDHLRKVHPRTGGVPENTEFFIEFIQSKQTVTRDYTQLHGMYLVGYNEGVSWTQSGIHLVTSGRFSSDQRKLDEYTKLLGLNSFPVIFEGTWASKEEITDGILDGGLKVIWQDIKNEISDADFTKNPLAVIDTIYRTFQQLQSSIGGQAEGVVITVGSQDPSAVELYKAQAADQLSKEARLQKKLRFRGTEQEESAYFSEINDIAEDIVTNQIRSTEMDDMLDELASIVYRMKVPVDHPKKSEINKQEDLFLTAKLLMLGTGTGEKIAVIPMAAKPMQRGHGSLIERAASECDSVIVYFSISTREGIGLEEMLPVWNRYYIPAIRREFGKKVIVKFSTGSPMKDAFNDVKNIVKRPGTQILVYGDAGDAVDRANQMKDYLEKVSPDSAKKVIPRVVDRSETGGISGTKMRSFIASGDEASFKKNLPDFLDPEERDGVWRNLSTAKIGDIKSENLLRNFVKSILAR